MFTRISSAINNPSFVSETAQTLYSTFTSTSETISSKLNDYPAIYDNYNKFTDNYSSLSNKFSENYSTFSSSLNNTKSSITSTLNTGTDYIYSIPNSIESQIFSYTSMLQLVDDSEEREIRTSPNDHLGDGVITLNSEREEIVNHILALYSCKPSKECFKYYDDSAVFEDPFMHASGLPNVKAQFYGMPKVFAKSTTDSYKILQNDPNFLIIDLNQRYVLPFIKRAIVLNSQITLEFNTENRKIIKHIDRWNGKAIGKGEMLRKGAAKIISTLIWVPEN